MDSLDSGSVLEVLDAFDAAWQQQPTPPLEPYLPPADHPSRQSILVGLVSIDMERRLKARQAVRTEDYLERFPELRQDEEQLLELILLEHRLRQQHGLGGSDDLYNRFPELADRLTVRLRETVPPVPDGGSVVRSSAGLDLREYVLLEALGQGGMGEVYRSRDPGLGRDLALKVLRPRWQGHREAQSRFEQEARITGSLQHPGVVPVHNLGRLPDGRLYFTMKVVRGRTFAEILHQPGERTAEQRAEDIAVFEKVCQTLAYAHSKGVIHRDLKPGNVMVGAFGEVQVMDWGLAKVLARDSARVEEPAMVPASSMMPARSEDSALHSRAGDVLGTYAYMAPEQASGSVDQLDERCDVFGLGAVLCEVLTGQPPYMAPTAAVLRDRAMRADLGPALARLESCGADAELVTLAKCCLAVEPGQRPHDAGEMARAVGAYLAGVQQRLREAERKQAAAEARAVEAAARVKVERRARRLLLGLAAAVLVVALGSVAGAWFWQQQRGRRRQAAQQVTASVERGRELLHEGWKSHDRVKLNEAMLEAERAVDLARREAIRTDLQRDAVALQAEVETRLSRWEKNRSLMKALLDVAIPERNRTLQAHQSGLMAGIVHTSANDQYADAFRAWGLDIDAGDEQEVVARLRDEPEPVVGDILAGLDAWMLARRYEEPPAGAWRRLYRVSQQLDRNTQRRQLRELLAEGNHTRAESVAGMLGLGLSWPALWDLTRGVAWRRGRLQTLRRGIDQATAPVLTVVLLAQVSSAVGEAAEAERGLRLALAARPDEIVLLNALGRLLEEQEPPRQGEAIECYRAIRARDRSLGVNLGAALGNADRAMEAEAVFRDLLPKQPSNYLIRFNLGVVLLKQKRVDETMALWQETIRLKPDFPEAHLNLGNMLSRQNKLAEATAAYKKVIHLKPDYHEAYNNLGVVLARQNRPAEAEIAHRKAIRLAPDDSNAYFNLAIALQKQSKLAEAESVYKKVIRLKPDDHEAYLNLGNTLLAQNKLAAAAAAYREAIRLEPGYHVAHSNLGVVLERQNKLSQAVAAFKEAIRLKPDYHQAHYSLGVVLSAQNKLAEAEAAYHEAIRLEPDLPDAHYSLGNVLTKQNKLAAAAATYREAVRLKPDFFGAYYNLGNNLSAQGKHEEAAAAFHEAIRLKPDLAEAHCNLGVALRSQGKFSESLAAYRRGHELGSQRPGWPYPSARWVRQARRLVELDTKLPALLKGEAQPKDAAEQIELASLCSLKRWHARSARFYADAFAAKSTLADDLKSGQRYNAACAAALAGCGQGKDADKLDDKQRAFWRRQALDWLNADRKGWSAILEKGDAPTITAVRQQMQRWRSEGDLSGVRDKAALAKLPADERKQWQKLWADVDALRQRAAGK